MPKHLNKTAIEWCDFSWNPVTGCKNNCPYCYARARSHRFKKSFEPTFHQDRLGIANTPIGAKVFVCSMGELFGPWVPALWTSAVLDEVRELPDVTFQFLTKFPENLARWNPWPENAWVGATATDVEMADAALNKLVYRVDAAVRFLSFEPLLGPMGDSLGGFLGENHGIDWVIIGAETGNRKGKPPLEDVHKWAAEIIHVADSSGVPLCLKDNLRWPVQRREWPVPQRQP